MGRVNRPEGRVESAGELRIRFSTGRVHSVLMHNGNGFAQARDYRGNACCGEKLKVSAKPVIR